jgi:RNA polymerase sigma factor (sigma-70 family)
VHIVQQAYVRSRAREGLGWVESLIDRARAGDLAAFEQLAERYLPEAYRLALAMVGPDEARDVAQDAMVAVWQTLPRLRDPARFESWLRSIVMNRARNVLRSQRRHPTTTIEERHTAALVDEPMSGVHSRLATEAAFADLNADNRAVLILHYVLDLPLRQVAEILGLREGTAKSRLHSGLRVLRARMTEPNP